MPNSRWLTAACLLIVAALAGWTGWWFFLATYGERVARAAGDPGLESRFEYTSSSRFGFPFQVGLEFADARFVAPTPDGRATATTSRLRVSARPWRPTTLSIELPAGMGFALFGSSPAQRVSGEARYGAGTATSDPASELALELDDIVARPATAGALRSARGRIVWRALTPQAGGGPQAVSIAFADIAMAEDALFGPHARRAEADLVVHGPFTDLAAWGAAGGRVDVRRMKVDWGALDLAAKGTVGLDDAYRLAGSLDLEVANGLAALRRIKALGLLQDEAASAARTLMALATLRGGGTASAELTFADGAAALAGMPVMRLVPVCDCR